MQPSNTPFIVAVGASAGGLEALIATLESCPADSGLCFIVIQHLSPDHNSMLPELLERHVEFKVLPACDGDEPEGDTVFVIPPRTQLGYENGRIRVYPFQKEPGQLALPINALFASLAAERKERCALVVLSGTGSDGAAGIEAGKRCGAITLAQLPETARFDGMPRAAISTGFVDLVLGPREVVPELMTMLDKGSSSYFNIASEHLELVLPRVLQSVKTHTGVDFNHYKMPTVVRRVQRRMRSLEVTDIREYADRVRESEDEARRLHGELLIGVTRFLRDDGAIAALRQTALPRLLQNGTHPLRLWVPGCSTGEEAYSLAMLLLDATRDDMHPRPFKIFATDVDESAIEFASLGEYSPESAMALPERLREEHFIQRGDRYVVTKRLREKLLFSRHDLLQDPPFSRMDMVSCRNLLIYFKLPAQERVLRLISHSMRDDGILWLGASESVSERLDTFEMLDGRWKIFVARPGRQRSSFAPFRNQLNGEGPRARQPDRMKLVMEQLQNDYVPPCLVVDENLRLLYRFGGLDQLIRLPHGPVSLDARDFLPESLSGLLSSVSARTEREETDVYFREVEVPLESGTTRFDLRIRRLRVEGSNVMTALFFESLREGEVDAPAQDLPLPTSDHRDRIATLEHELRLSRENLQATIEELESSNEELQATNEELIAANEELQSTNEELQSVNEELHNVNCEHGEKLNELSQLHDDLDNLFSSVDIAILFLDGDMMIRRFNEAVERYFNVLPHDSGRPLGHLSHRMEYGELLGDCQRVLTTGEPTYRRTRAGQDVVLVRITPHRSEIYGVQGVVVTIADITEVDTAERNLEQLMGAFRDSAASICLLDELGRIQHANATFLNQSGYSEAELRGSDWVALMPEVERDRGRDLVSSALHGQSFRGMVRLQTRDQRSYFELARLSRASRRDSALLYIGEALHTEMKCYHEAQRKGDPPPLGRSCYSLWSSDPSQQTVDPSLAELLGLHTLDDIKVDAPRTYASSHDAEALGQIFATPSSAKAKHGYMFSVGDEDDERRLLLRLGSIWRTDEGERTRFLLEISELPVGPSGWRGARMI